MRTTLKLDADVVAEVERIRRQEGIGISEAVNRLARRGMRSTPPARRFRQRSADLGIKVDVSDIGAVLDLLDES